MSLWRFLQVSFEICAPYWYGVEVNFLVWMSIGLGDACILWNTCICFGELKYFNVERSLTLQTSVHFFFHLLVVHHSWNIEQAKAITLKDTTIHCQTVATAIQWLLSFGLLHDLAGRCPECGEGSIYLAPLKSLKDAFKWRCNNRVCKKSWSIHSEMWFECSHLSLEKIRDADLSVGVQGSIDDLISREVGTVKCTIVH